MTLRLFADHCVSNSIIRTLRGSGLNIDRNAFLAKFWLNPVALAYNLGFPARELRKLEGLTAEHREELLEA